MKISNLSTKEVIRFLPLDSAIKQKLMETYPDKVSYEQGSKIEELVWDLYYQYFDIVYQHNLDKEIADASGPLAPGFQDRLLAQTEEQIMNEMETKGTSSQLEELRQQLDKMISS